MQQKENINEIYVVGEVIASSLSYFESGSYFIKGLIRVPRKSGTNDILRFSISEKLLQDTDISFDKPVLLCGLLRNVLISGEKHRSLMIFVRTILNVSSDRIGENYAKFTGNLSVDAKYRTTPFGKKITELYVKENKKTYSISMIAWSRLAVLTKDLKRGDYVSLYGRLQSREYIKVLPDWTEEKNITYEVSVFGVHLY